MVNIWRQSLVEQLTLRLQRRFPVVILSLWILHKQALISAKWINVLVASLFECKTWILSKCNTATPFTNTIYHLGKSQSDIHFGTWLITQWVMRHIRIHEEWGYIKRILKIMCSTRKKPSSSGSLTSPALRSSRSTGSNSSIEMRR